jgi:hypothetical protein
MIVWEAFLPRKAADSLTMGYCHRTTLALSKMQGKKSLMLCSQSFLGDSSDVVATILA